MTMKQRKVSRTFLRYFFSYFIMFFLPVIILNIMFYLHYVKVYRNEVFLNNANQTLKIRDSIESHVEQLDRTFMQLRTEEEFVEGFNNSDYNRITTYNRLASYKQLNDFIYDIIYFQKDIITVISSISLMNIETMENYHMKYDNWSNEKMLNDVYSAEFPYWRSFEKVKFAYKDYKQILTYVCPLSSYKKANPNALVFQIEKASFNNVINMYTSEKSIVIIRNSEGETIFSSTENTESFIPAINSITIYDSSDLGNSEHGKYFVSSAKSTYNDWTYYSILPIDLALEKVSDLQLSYIILTILLLIIGILCVYYISYVNYNPIKSLVKSIESYFKSPQEGLNEIDVARNALVHLGKTNREMEERIKNSYGYVKASLLQNLLHGCFDIIENFNRKGARYGLRFDNRFFFILAIEKRKLLQYENVTANRLQSFVKDFEIFLAENIDHDHIIYICSNKENHFENIIRQLEDFNNSYEINECIGLSSFTSDISQLYRKYIEALNSLQNADNSASSNIIVFGSNDFSSTSQYPDEDIEKIKDSLMNEDVKQFNACLIILLKYVSNSKASIFLKVCTCYDVINAMIRSLMSYGKELIPDLSKYNMMLSTKNNSLETLCDLLDKLGQDVTNQMISSGAYCKSTFIDDIKSYIESRIFDYDFSVQSTADHYNMSSTNLSHYFKNNTGITFTNYISQLKMDYAMELLRNTEDNLQSITEKIGYTNISSFIRKFKKYTGVTPGTYRDAHTR